MTTPAELAVELRTTTDVLKKWRYTGAGPRYVKTGRRVLYPRAEIDKWLRQNTHTSTA